MVNGVNWNPFTNKALTQEEIKYIDENYGNKNGVAEESEITKARSWLAGKDLDGQVEMDTTDDVSDVEGSEVWKKAQEAGSVYGIEMDNVKTDGQFDAAFEVIIESFIEEFATANGGMTAEMKAAMKDTIKASKADFLKEKNIKKDAKYKTEDGKYNMEMIANEFAAYMNKKLETDFDKSKILQGQIDDKKSGLDDKYNKFMKDSSKLGDELSAQEWVDLRTEALEYIMAMLLAAETTDKQNDQFNDFLKNLGINGVNGNADLKKAKNYCDKIKTETNPDKIKEYMDLATQCILKFLNTKGKDKVAGAAKKSSQDQTVKNAQESLGQVADRWVDTKITGNMSDSDKQVLKDFAKKCLTEYISKCYVNGVFTPINNSGVLKPTPETDFNTYLDNSFDALNKNKGYLKTNYADKTESLFGTLAYTTKNANNNGNISDAEKADIIDAASEFIIAELINGIENVELLQHLSVSSSDLKKIKDCVQNLKTCSGSEDELKDLIKTAKDTIKEILNKYSGEQLTLAVNKSKSMEPTNKMKDDAIYTSDLYADYQTGATRETSRSDDHEALRKEVEELARQDMKKYAESLKVQLQNELGAAFNDSDFEKIVESAINDTITQFWKGYEDLGKAKHFGSCETGTNHFISHRKGGTHDRRYQYNVKDLIDAFDTNFKKAAKQLKIEQRDPSKITYDFEDVLVSSGLADEYQKGDTHEIRSDKEDKTVLLNEAREIVNSLKAQIRASLIAKGSTIPITQIDKMLNDAAVDVLKNPDEFITSDTRDPGGVWSLGVGLRANRTYYKLHYQKLIDLFKDGVDRRISEYWSKDKTTTSSSTTPTGSTGSGGGRGSDDDPPFDPERKLPDIGDIYDRFIPNV